MKAAKKEWATLADRLTWCVKTDRVKSLGAWSIAAGRTRQHAATLAARSRTSWKEKGEEHDPGTGVISDLARVAKVDPRWLGTGVGAPEPPSFEPLERYPNRAEAVAVVRKLGVSERAIADVEAEAAHSNEDYPVRTWVQRFLNRQQMLDDLESGRGAPGRNLSEDEV